ncbi:MAG: adenylate/guanylate cyclase domain-containing protein, partial [Treponemataceae bacterium]|nr:adenylate/guanylate cyclase domain-containing protein [Treponemataceae bacterium]
MAQVKVTAESILDYGVFVSTTGASIPQRTADSAAPARQAPTIPAKPVSPEPAETEVSVSDFLLDADTDAPITRKDEIRNMLATEKNALEQEKKRIKQLKKEEKRAAKQKAQENRIRNPIGLKMIVIISVLLLTAVGGITYIVSFFMTGDIRTNAEENNLAINSRTAASVEAYIDTAVSGVGMFLDLLKTAGENDAESRAMTTMFFARNKDVAAVYLPGSDTLFANDAFLLSREIQRETVRAYLRQETEAAERARGGSFELLNASAFFSVPSIALFYPVSYSDADNAIGVLLSADALGESFSSSNINQSFFVNNDGAVLVHGDMALQMSGADESGNPIVQAMMESVLGGGQITYKAGDGEEFIGAFRKLSTGNGGVITTVRTAIVLEGIRRQTVRNVYIMLAILAIALMVVYF